ncbi:uncharacterized protein LOC131211162 isoform X2 [Anopheles bellator]|uniref:uncharacterized protein LOC131211162 isoform X2 n=1 Tax=Anopheles bellator TaxID=139047 RepID=UPI0026472395|nr:uncharacterized protein LOC131211162 isoform X2 [Anopheles bellator]
MKGLTTALLSLLLIAQQVSALNGLFSPPPGAAGNGSNVDGLGINTAGRRRRDLFSLLPPPGPLARRPLLGAPPAPAPGGGSPVVPNNLPLSGLLSGGLPSNLSSPFIPPIPANYTQAFETLVTQFRTLPLNGMDSIVRSLSTAYNSSFSRMFTENGFKRINASLEQARSVIGRGVDSIVDQGMQGFEQAIASYNRSSGRVQQCVGRELKPTALARRVVGKGKRCVNRKWNELSQIGSDMANDIVTADTGAREFLGNLSACQAANLAPNATSVTELNTQRRQCYVRAIGSFPMSMLFIPVNLAVKAGQLYGALQTLQTHVALCSSEMGVEIGLATAEVTSKIALCTALPPS